MAHNDFPMSVAPVDTSFVVPAEVRANFAFVRMENTPARRVARGGGVGATPGPPSIPPPMTPPVVDGKIDWKQIEAASSLPGPTSPSSSAGLRPSHGVPGVSSTVPTTIDGNSGNFGRKSSVSSKNDEVRTGSTLTPIAHPPVSLSLPVIPSFSRGFRSIAIVKHQLHLEAPVFVRSVHDLKATMSQRDVLSSVRGPPGKSGGASRPHQPSPLVAQQSGESNHEVIPASGQDGRNSVIAPPPAADGRAHSSSKSPEPLLGQSASAKSSRRSSNGTSRTEISSMPDVEDLDVRLAVSEPEPVVVADVLAPPAVHGTLLYMSSPCVRSWCCAHCCPNGGCALWLRPVCETSPFTGR
jgi:hypothetical protein